MLSRGKFIIHSKFVFYRFFFSPILLFFDVVVAFAVAIAVIVVVTVSHTKISLLYSRARYLCSLSNEGVGKLAKHSLSRRKSYVKNFN